MSAILATRRQTQPRRQTGLTLVECLIGVARHLHGSRHGAAGLRPDGRETPPRRRSGATRDRHPVHPQHGRHAGRIAAPAPAAGRRRQLLRRAPRAGQQLHVQQRRRSGVQRARCAGAGRSLRGTGRRAAAIERVVDVLQPVAGHRHPDRHDPADGPRGPGRCMWWSTSWAAHAPARRQARWAATRCADGGPPGDPRIRGGRVGKPTIGAESPTSGAESPAGHSHNRPT